MRSGRAMTSTNQATAWCTTANDTADELDAVTAEHEAAHAVMRWLRGMPATELTLGTPGNGSCAGTGGRARIEDRILFCLAGLASEVGCVSEWLNLAEVSGSPDIDEARALLSDYPAWRPFDPAMREPVDLETALRRYFDRACDLLWPEMELVEAIGRRLQQARCLSARTVAALCREHARKTRLGDVA